MTQTTTQVIDPLPSGNWSTKFMMPSGRMKCWNRYSWEQSATTGSRIWNGLSGYFSQNHPDAIQRRFDVECFDCAIAKKQARYGRRSMVKIIDCI